MKINHSSYIVSFDCYPTTICSFERNSYVIDTVYMHSSMQENTIISSIDCIDEMSRRQISSNMEFSNFISRSLDVIRCTERYHQIKLEKLEDNDFWFEKYRLTFYLEATYRSSIFDNDNDKLEKKETFRKISKILFKESKELRRAMVIDEREL